MNDIANAFNRVRYASDPAWEPRGHEPIGFDVTAGGDTLKAETPRRYVCDFLKENGREEEADSIQHYDGPVALDQGKLKPGRYDHQPVLDAMQPLERHLDDWSVQGHIHPYIRVETGANNDIDPEDDEDYFDAEDDDDTDEPLEEGHVRVAHANGQHDSDEPEEYGEIEHDDVHYDDLADHLADIIGNHAARQHRDGWGPHNNNNDEPHYHDLTDDANNDLDDLFSLRNLTGYLALSRWRRQGTGSDYYIEQAVGELSIIQKQVEDGDVPDKDGKIAALISSLTKHFTDMQEEPENTEKQNVSEFNDLLSRLRQTRPVSPL